MSALRGRKPLIRAVYSYEAPLATTPAMLVLDTSFVIRALNPSEDGHAEAQVFLSHLASGDTTICYNRLLELELAEVAFKLAVIEQHGKKAWPAKRNDGRVRRRAGRLAQGLLEQWAETLANTKYLCIELEEVSGDVPAVMTNYGLASYDAVHAATATYVEADGLVTADAGFGAVPETVLRLYVDATRVRSCRRRRGGS